MLLRTLTCSTSSWMRYFSGDLALWKTFSFVYNDSSSYLCGCAMRTTPSGAGQTMGQPLHADVIQAIRTTLQSWFRRQLAREAPGLSARESHGRFNTFLKRNCGGTRLFDLVLRQGIADFRAIHAQLIMFACQESSRPMPNVLLPHAFAQHLPPLPGETRNQREQWRHYVDTLTDPTEKAAAMQQIGMLTITLTWFTGPRRSSWRDATHALNRRVQLRGAYPDLR